MFPVHVLFSVSAKFRVAGDDNWAKYDLFNLCFSTKRKV